MVDVEHTEVSARRGGTRQVGRDRVASWARNARPAPLRVPVPLASVICLRLSRCLLHLSSVALSPALTCVTCLHHLRHLRPPAPSAPPASSCAICATHSNTRASRARTSTSAASASERSTAPLPYLPAHSTRTSTPSSSGALLLAAVSRLSRDPCTPHIADGVHEHEDGQL